MDWPNFINQIVDLGIDAAKRDYKRPDQEQLLNGSVAGFEACRDKNIVGLVKALQSAQRASKKHFGTAKHWYYRGFLLEVEWVCNVASAALYNQKQPVIITPTARGMQTAAQILGVKEQ